MYDQDERKQLYIHANPNRVTNLLLVPVEAVVLRFAPKTIKQIILQWVDWYVSVGAGAGWQWRMTALLWQRQSE